MPTVRRTTVGWLVAAVLALVVSTVGLARPAGAADGTCDGVWVVVDARGLGGELTTRCAPGNPSSGLEALELTGHSYAFVPRQPGMVCTIDARPDPCNGAPTDAYWGYFHADAGGDWTYAVRGAGNRDPEPGSVEGWAFGDDVEPGRRPPSNEPASEPEPEPEPEPQPTSSSPAPPATSTSPEPAATREETSAAPSVPATDTATATDQAADEAAPDPTTDTGEGGATATTESPTGARESDADLGATAPTDDTTLAGDADPEEGSDKGATAAIVGGLLVTGIAGAGAVRSRRRDDGQV